ncbi:MAG: DHH family phosphoesterase, partial [Candidatus Blackburnbacteria bacterium]|nr:DHH family phosphoesterase [Candidatus Blackburnbacteria bacterium]
MKLITAYTNPDLDGTACAIGYAEYSSKKEENSLAAFFGIPSKEALWVLSYFGVNKVLNAEEFIKLEVEVVMVDASDRRGLSPLVISEQVVEIIDHRKVNESHLFPNAKLQIEFVGSAATLIAEKFFESQFELSRESAGLLYSAIVSNTINFKAEVTTDRDRKIAEWLLAKLDLPADFVHQMFAAKSYTDETLEERFASETASFNLNGKEFGCIQLEILEVGKFVKENKEETEQLLLKIKKERKLDGIFLSCIDVEEGFNVFISLDEWVKELLEEKLAIKFEENIAHRDGIIMRKEIMPL